MNRIIVAVAFCGLLPSGCLSASVTDARLTVLGRTAIPRAGQSQTQQVIDVAICREGIMDSFLYVGAYTLYNPLRYSTPEEALAARQQQLAQCIRARGYDLVESAAPRLPAH